MFTLVVLPHRSTVVAAVLFSAALIAFFWLVKATEILQDVSAPLRPDGQSPYSLARVQMAVWFFLVVAAWFLLFRVTRRYRHSDWLGLGPDGHQRSHCRRFGNYRRRDDNRCSRAHSKRSVGSEESWKIAQKSFAPVWTTARARDT